MSSAISSHLPDIASLWRADGRGPERSDRAPAFGPPIAAPGVGEAERPRPAAVPPGDAQARTLFQAKEAAQAPAATTGDVGPADAEPKSDAVAKFLEYMSLTPEERLYRSILEEMGLTEEQLAALPPEERARIEREIQEKIQERLIRQSETASEEPAT